MREYVRKQRVIDMVSVLRWLAVPFLLEDTWVLRVPICLDKSRDFTGRWGILVPNLW
jgi:hypothetical protein